MCCLAAHACPLGGFWADSQKFAKTTQLNMEIHAIQFISKTVQYAEIKSTKNNSLYLDSFLKCEFDVSLTPKHSCSLLALPKLVLHSNSPLQYVRICQTRCPTLTPLFQVSLPIITLSLSKLIHS